MSFFLFEFLPDKLKNQTDYPKIAKSVIPTEFWSAGDLFYGVADFFWQKKTHGVFPMTTREDKSTHPLFVVSSSNYGLRICPCTSKSPDPPPRWYIPGGVSLRNTGEIKDRTTYILKNLEGPLRKDETVSQARYWGMFPPEELCEEK